MSRPSRPGVETLEARLGHVFKDKSLLRQALTHISAAPSLNRMESYQRLEFLGDRVLGLVVAEMLFQTFPDEAEGVLSRRLSDLVRKETCAAIAMAWDLGPYLRLGAGESRSGGRRRITILGDACEALIGAVFADGGYEAARRLVERFWRSALEESEAPVADAKTALQEWAQAQGLATPAYHLVSRSGPDHSPMFVIKVEVELWPPAEGSGRTKRLAEQEAAKAFMAQANEDEG